MRQQVNNTSLFLSSPQLEDNRGGGGSDDSSLDIMTTVFVHRVLPDGVAEQVGVREGDKVFSIGGERITSASHEGVVALLKMQVEELVMVLCPKSDDVLQLSVSGWGAGGDLSPCPALPCCMHVPCCGLDGTLQYVYMHMHTLLS